MTRSATRSLARTAAYATAFAALYAVAVRTGWGQHQDAWSLGFQGALGPPQDLLVYLRQDSVVLGALAVGLAAGAALRERRRRDLAAAGLLVVVAVGLAHGLRVAVLGRPVITETDYRFNTFPSGHAAATTALVVAVLLLGPPRWRRPGVAVLGALVAAAAALASVLTLAHRAGDALGGVLLVGVLLPAARWLAGRAEPAAQGLVTGLAGAAAAAGVTAYVAGVGHSAALSTLGLAVALLGTTLDVCWSATGPRVSAQAPAARSHA